MGGPYFHMTPDHSKFASYGPVLIGTLQLLVGHIPISVKAEAQHTIKAFINFYKLSINSSCLHFSLLEIYSHAWAHICILVLFTI